MGWVFPLTTRTKAALVAYLVKPEIGSDAITRTTIAHRTIGNRLWRVLEIAWPDATSERHIVLDLLQSHRAHGWGSKSMSESMGPYFYDCPLSFFKLVPAVQDTRWRQQVRLHHAYRRDQLQRLKDAKLGDTLILQECSIPSITLTSKRPMRGLYEGTTYRVTPRYIALDRPRPTRHFTEAEEHELALIAQGRAVRASARSTDDGHVHVLFRTQTGYVGYFMSREMYDALPIGRTTTVEDYAALGKLESAPNDFPPIPEEDIAAFTKQLADLSKVCGSLSTTHS